MGLDNLTAIWNRVRDSLWFLPAVLTLASVVLALVTIQLDVSDVLPEAPGGVWLFSGTAAGARGVLTAIASGFITVTGVVFSVTIVAIQLASTQFTPRILRNFTADRVNQLVLGVFIATFTYALLVLRVVEGDTGGVTPEDLAAGGGAAGASAPGFVPNLSVTVAVVLAVVSIGFLIYFIDHAARSVQASVIIDRVTAAAVDTLDRRLPARVGEPGDDDVETVIPAAQGHPVVARASGYLQGVDQDALLSLLGRDAVTIRMEPRIGEFVLAGGTLATVWPAGLAGDDLERSIHDAFILGHERTPHLDVELGVIELVDIAVKALSPGINDPTTATLCVDRICEVLLDFARREPPGRVRRLPREGGVLVLPRLEFDRLVDTALDGIRRYGVEDPRFTRSVLDRLVDLGRLLPADRKPPVARHAAALLRTAREATRDPWDLRRVEAAGERALAALDVGRPT
ncbi:MAG: DUF2254 domain-containing protein [Gemmatimonadetes bacterium]|nr:DUF2254 domain-containing protein [Gemmatimonadota bacterium]NIQ55877.1 DUF2254 domain-containing protein [Gemmatimonadota bacterium]NIU76079.1 DUF2254 domain-containing protein [Gammaproteobacteria bacterium]NIX45637.1 DUF2254 domain-containing protein [Gemmatimonadota bacterium]NIY09929.1 DUF2254 domain-containing protein [Gemmatimonadota bacterium]